MATSLNPPLDFKSCEDVDPALIDRAFEAGSGSPKDAVLRLVERMARVAQPEQGAHRILEVLARLSQSAWVDGALDIVLRDFGLATEIDIRLDAGRHFERVRTISVAVPLAELADWAGSNPDLIAPLIVFDTRRDDELRLRRASGRITAVPRSSSPLVPPSVPPGSLRGRTPPVRPSLPELSPPPPSVRGRTPPVRPAAPDSARRPPISARGRTPPAPPASAEPAAAVRAAAPTPAHPVTPVDAETRAAPKDVYGRETSPEIYLPSEASRSMPPPPDFHRKDTPRLAKLELPQEAYRTGPSEPARPEKKSTARVPVVKPPPVQTSDPDPTDEGWE
ncbi:MAG: hypothetical protein U0263_14995 [Polyangiaceae bacterium]